MKPQLSAQRDAQFRRSILLELEVHQANQKRLGIGPHEAAAVFCSRYPWLSRSTLYRWAREFREHGVRGLDDGRSGRKPIVWEWQEKRPPVERVMRLRILRAWWAFLEDQKGKRRNRAYAQRIFCSHRGMPCINTLYRWEKRFRMGGADALLDGRSDKVGRPMRVPRAAQSFFNRIFCRKGYCSVAEAWRRTQAEAKRRGWRWPSLRTVQDRVKRSKGSGHDGRKNGRSKPVR
jgi:transposase